MKNVSVVLMMLFMVAACSTHPVPKAKVKPISVDEVKAAQTWGAADNVTQLKYLYFSEQPDAVTLEKAAARGVTTVINLRGPGEMSWDEEKAAAQHGLKYVNIPIQKQADGFDSEAIAAISATVRAQEGRPVLLHCSSGNRAAGWLAVHLIEDHAMDLESALNVARKAGLTRDSIEKRVRNHIDDER